MIMLTSRNVDGMKRIVVDWVTLRTVFSILLSIPIAQSSSFSQTVQKDSTRIQVESNQRPFQLIPKFDDKKDSAGFKFIPKQDSGNGEFVDGGLSPSPTILKRVDPVYPDSAVRAGVEGKVIVKMWVNESGRVGDVVILKSDAAIFNQPVIDAAKQFLFAPALVNNKPVAVWIAYPFRFSLTGRN
jgi:TonB family protein